MILVCPRIKDLPNYTPPGGVILVNKTGGTFNDDIDKLKD
jgi:hypothetical protein